MEPLVLSSPRVFNSGLHLMELIVEQKNVLTASIEMRYIFRDHPAFSMNSDIASNHHPNIKLNVKGKFNPRILVFNFSVLIKSIPYVSCMSGTFY